MKRIVALLLAVELLAGSAIVCAQATRIQSSGTLPTNCTTGSIYQKTGTGAGLYVCTGTNTWSAVGSTQTIYWPTAICDQSGVYAPLWTSLTGASGPDYSACWGGSNVEGAALDFTDSSTQYLWQQFLLPSDWTGAIDLLFVWRSSATSGNAVWQVQTACSAVGETIDPAWNTAQTVTDATQGVANRMNTAAISSITTTGCAAGEMLWFRILRDPSHASDTLGASAQLIGVQMTYRRSL